MYFSKSTNRIIKKYGRDKCLKAFFYNVNDGEGAYTIGSKMDLHIRTVESLIGAGEEIYNRSIPCELYHSYRGHGQRKLGFEGDLYDLLTKYNIFYKLKEVETGVYRFTFKSTFITFEIQGLESDFSNFAKKALQMELVRIGDPSILIIKDGKTIRPEVSVNLK